MATVAEIEDYAREQMEAHGIEGWELKWSRAIGYMGNTNFTHKIITLSAINVEHHTVEEGRDTALHEIAHVLAGYQAGHNYQWRKIAREIGARPEAALIETGKTLREAVAPWVGRCAAGHESEHRYFRKPKLRRSCSVCNPGRFSPDHILTYTKEV